MERTEKKPVIAYVGLGANLGDAAETVASALVALGELPETERIESSSLYCSPPMGPQDQPDFINATATLRTTFSPLMLLEQLQAIEVRYGRVREGPRWGPRTLDLDLLLYGDWQISDERLTVPHPGLHRRSFVLMPLYETAPDLIIPGRGPLKSLLETVEILNSSRALSTYGHAVGSRTNGVH